MPEHINVISYLLGAIVFSVGFLSARLHASANAQRQQVNDASWRVREIHARGGRLAPSELAALLSVVRTSADSIARLLRLLNMALVGAVLIVAADFLWRLPNGIELSPHAPFLAGILSVAAIAVGIVGEIDGQHLQRTVAREIEQTSLGHILKLEQALAARDLGRGKTEIAVLERAFPEWGLLVELRALVAHLGGDSEAALRILKGHLHRRDDEIYVLPVVAAAAAMALKRPGEAIRILDEVRARRELNVDERTLLQALRLRVGHLDAIFSDSTGGAAPDPTRPVATSAPNALNFLGVGIEELSRHEHGSMLDIRVADFPQLMELITDLETWTATESDRLSAPGGPLAALNQLADDGALSAASIGLLKATVDGSDDWEAIETCGFILLIDGDPKDAVQALERAMRLNPKSPRIHWAHAVGCMYWGWRDKAEESLGRAASLDADDLVVRLTRRRLIAGAPEGATPPVALSQAECLQLALIGIEAESSGEAPSLQRRISREALRLARQRSDQLRGTIGEVSRV